MPITTGPMTTPTLCSQNSSEGTGLAFHRIDAKHRKIIESVVAWLTQEGTNPTRSACSDGEALRQATVAGTFSYLCSPPDAEQTPPALRPEDPMRGYRYAAQMIVLFFLLDDRANTDDLTQVERLARDRSWSSGSSGPSAIRNGWAEFLRRLEADFGDATVFSSAVADLCRAMRCEPTLGDVDDTEFWRVRSVTIAVPLLAALWEVMSHLQLSDTERSSASRLRDLTSQIVTLANDLGSFNREAEAQRECAGGEAIANVILRLSRQHDISTERAKELTIRRYNALTLQFDIERNELLRNGSPGLRRYADGLARCANGNLLVTKYLLTTRYSFEPYLALARQVREDHVLLLPEDGSP